MVYTPTTWKDRVVDNPRTFNVVDNPDGTITLLPAPGAVHEAGTPVNAANLNNIEQGIVDAKIIIDNVTDEKWEWKISDGAVFLEKVVE